VRADSAESQQGRAGQRTLAGQLGRLRRKSRRPVLALADQPEPSAAGQPEPSAAPPGTDARQRRRQHRVTGSAWLAVIPAGIVAVVLTVHAVGGPRQAIPAPRVAVASLPYWNLSQGTAAVLANLQAVSEVSPWIYGLASDGQIVLDSGISKPALSSSLSQLRARGLPLVPTIANVDAQGSWAYPPVARILHDPVLMARHVAAIVALADSGHYAGIDIDYEGLRAGDRQVFTAFVTRLAGALHARGKILSVALFAKATDAGYAPRNVAQDYAAIGKVADQVRLMGYDYHWSTSPPGPVAPVSWLRSVLSYARKQLPAAKIILGVPVYGYDWSRGHGAGITWQQAMQLSRQPGVRLRYSTASQAPWFSYTDAAGRQHTVWFEDARSSRAKFRLAQAAGIGGVYVWMYGNADPGMWPALRQALPAGPRASVPAVRSAS
jgi:spore germination protein YaaH